MLLVLETRYHFVDLHQDMESGKFQKGLVDRLKNQPLKKGKEKTVFLFFKSGKNSDSTMFTKDKLKVKGRSHGGRGGHRVQVCGEVRGWKIKLLILQSFLYSPLS